MGAAEDRMGYKGTMKVKPCTTYSYVLTMAYAGSKTSDLQGDLAIPCIGEYFLTPIGEKFVPELEDENDLQNFGLGESKSAEVNPVDSVANQLEEIKDLELETEFNITGEDSEFSNEPVVGV